MQVIDAETAHRCICGVVVEAGRSQLGDLAPARAFFRSDVTPVLPAVARDPDHAVVGPSPDGIDALARECERIDGASLLAGFGVLGRHRAQAWRDPGLLACQVSTDRFPRRSAVDRLE